MKESKIERLTKYYNNEAGMTARKLKNRLAKEEAKEQAEKNQKPVTSIIINIEWKRSATWGSNPHAEARVTYTDGSYEYRNGFTCSGCGYDKESTVISQVFNALLKYKLWNMEEDIEKQKSKPYGVYLDYDYSPYYSYGIGTSCYYKISEFIGGKFECVSSGKTFDVYKFTSEV